MIHTMRRLTCAVAVALMCAAGAAAQSGSQDPNKPVEQFTAIATNISFSSPVGASQMDVVIERWTTVAENERLIAALQAKGQQGLLEALQKMPRIGYLRTPGSLAYEMRFAQESRARDGRRRIIMLTDRPIGFGEASQRPITIDYPFTSVDLRVDDQGSGEGTVSVATKVILSGDLMVLEGFADQPIRLRELKRRK
jgi:hypothetical protein